MNNKENNTDCDYYLSCFSYKKGSDRGVCRKVFKSSAGVELDIPSVEEAMKKSFDLDYAEMLSFQKISREMYSSIKQ